ncbi:MAG: hypothetical protein U9N87_04510 [Planctomycetota bacterium]|nr:hypothetical protein [Planctomycetota bacterium]
MSKSKNQKNQTEPAQRLKQEAMAQRPGFSQSLHDRLCAAIRENSPDTKRDAPRPLKIRARPWAPSRRSFVSAAAACLIVAAAGLLWWSHTSQPRIALPADGPNPLATLADAAGQTTLDAGLAAEDALAANRWGRLDEDAKTAAKMILNSLPFDMLARKQSSPRG